MSKKLKIAIYTGITPSNTFIDRLINGLAYSGNSIFIFGLQKQNPRTIPNVYYLTYTNKFSKLIQLLKYSTLLFFFKGKEKKQLDTIIANKNLNSRQLKIKYYPVLYHRPDIFHLQWVKGIADWQWVQEFGIKLIVSLRGTHLTISPIGDDNLKKIYQQYFPKVDAFHTVSNSMIPLAESYGALPHKLSVIKSGFSLTGFIFKKKEQLQTPLQIISIGRSHWVKGYSYAIDAMRKLKQEGIPFHYTIIGVANQEEILYKRSYYHLQENVTFNEKASYRDVLKAIVQADVLVLSSVEEGIANVVIEAMALGTLVVATNCGGMNELINHNKNGLLVPHRNPIALAEAIIRINSMPIEEYHAFTQEARKTVEENHNEKQMISKMNHFYESLIQEKK